MPTQAQDVPNALAPEGDFNNITRLNKPPSGGFGGAYPANQAWMAFRFFCL